MRSAALAAILWGLVPLAAQTPSDAQTKPRTSVVKRAFEIDDVFRDAITYGYASPDGTLFAYYHSISLDDQVKRLGDLRDFGWRRDYWLYSPQSGKTTMLFRAGDDGWDLCNVYWSPDGRYLALRVGAGIRYEFQIWERATGKKTTVTPTLISDVSFVPPKWVSNTRLAVIVSPQPEAPVDPRMGLNVQDVIAGWIERERGIKPTVSVLNSEIGSNETVDHGRLLLIDAERKTSEVLMHGNVLGVAGSPQGTRFAFQLTGGRAHVGENESFTSQTDIDPQKIMVDSRKIMIQDLAGGRHEPVPIPGVEHAIRDANSNTALAWSPDGASLAYLNGTSAKALPDVQMYSIGARAPITAKFDKSSRPPFKAADLKWIYPHQLLVSTSVSGEPKCWNLVSEDGSVRALRTSQKIPAQIYPESKDGAFLFASAGKLWRYDLASESEKCLSCSSSVEVANIVQDQPESMIVSAKENGIAGDFLYRKDAGGFRRLKLPGGPRYYYSHWDPATGNGFVYAQGTSNASVQSVNMFDGRQKMLSRADKSYRDEIDTGEVRLIDYRSSKGQPLKANLLLPHGYEPGKRYPTVVSVYPGFVWNAPHAALNSVAQFPVSQLWFSAHGYAVLEPSIPLPDDPGPQDHNLELTNGVLPAMDKLIEMGIADPDRLAVIGHSYGGYAVFGLITQTNRFKAAIASAGNPDLISYYGEFEGSDRYTTHPEESMRNAQWSESGQAKLYSTPWNDPQRYIRNSPLFSADHVQTPVLIVQGEQDFVPIAQGEEFFTAMLRLNKPARFLRYWGEGHSPSSPANIRDFHQQMLDWLDMWLNAKNPPRPASH